MPMIVARNNGVAVIIRPGRSGEIDSVPLREFRMYRRYQGVWSRQGSTLRPNGSPTWADAVATGDEEYELVWQEVTEKDIRLVAAEASRLQLGPENVVVDSSDVRPSFLPYSKRLMYSGDAVYLAVVDIVEGTSWWNPFLGKRSTGRILALEKTTGAVEWNREYIYATKKKRSITTVSLSVRRGSLSVAWAEITAKHELGPSRQAQYWIYRADKVQEEWTAAERVDGSDGEPASSGRIIGLIGNRVTDSGSWLAWLTGVGSETRLSVVRADRKKLVKALVSTRATDMKIVSTSDGPLVLFQERAASQGLPESYLVSIGQRSTRELVAVQLDGMPGPRSTLAARTLSGAFDVQRDGRGNVHVVYVQQTERGVEIVYRFLKKGNA